ncbi:MAG: iron ABC transporter permease [Gammaproteobacteria bacterium]|jgi:iron(III) transport system permease protein|nr:iron ABC transporter permease [Gammaproteobacteria bacterium]
MSVSQSFKFRYVPSLKWVALIVAALVLLPIVAVLQQAAFVGNDLWLHIWQTVLPDYVSNSLLLMLGVGAGVLMMGVPAAWLAAMCQFPGRRWLDWALLLPLAMPAYIIAYTYTGILDYAGPVQSGLRHLTGWGYGDYWFWQVRSLSGAMAMMVLVLYPYVYLTARATFLEQSSVSMDVARSLGYSRWQAWFKVAVPMARPAIIAGLTLALMETLADYGTVQYFGVATFTTGIFRTFYGFGDTAGAAQLAAVLLLFVVTLIVVERWSRRRQAYHVKAQPRATATAIVLLGWRGWLACCVCLIPVVFGFIIPAGQLLWWTLFEAHVQWSSFWQLAWNSFYLSALAAVLAVCLALLLAYAQRFYPRQSVRHAVTLAGMGYALPGTIIAIGVMLPLAWLDHRINDAFTWLGWSSPGLLLSGTLVVLLMAYCVRFLAVALGGIQSGLGQVSPSLDESAKGMGRNAWDVLRLIHIPLMRSSVLTALLVVFVDVLKELPATLMLRPFDFNTLAVRAYELAADEQLVEAAPASLMIVLVGLIPVLILNRAINRRRQRG